MELSRAIPHLKANGVRCIAVGLERFGVDDFVAGNFWEGEVYVDEGKKAYKALQLQSTGKPWFMQWRVLYGPTIVTQNLNPTGS
jgi:hypothetical protein